MGHLCMWSDSRASSRVETGMLGNFLSCSKGVKDPLEVPDVRCYYKFTTSCLFFIYYYYYCSVNHSSVRTCVYNFGKNEEHC